MTFEYEKLLAQAKKDGITFSDGQKTYFECARINSLSLLDSIYNAYVMDLHECEEKEHESEIFKKLEWLADIRELFDDNLCKVIRQAMDMQIAGE